MMETCVSTKFSDEIRIKLVNDLTAINGNWQDERFFLLIFNLSIRQRNKTRQRVGENVMRRQFHRHKNLEEEKELDANAEHSTWLNWSDSGDSCTYLVTPQSRNHFDRSARRWWRRRRRLIHLFISNTRAHNGINNIHRIFSIELKHKYVHTLVSVVVHVGPSAKASTCKINHNMH